jgi:opacity protein-like surface antigen
MKRIKFNIASIFILILFASNTMAQAKHECSTDCSPYPWSLRVFGSPLLTNITSDTYSAEEHPGLGFNFGGDVIYTFFRHNKLSLNTSLGLGLTRYNTTRKGDYKNQLWTSEYEQVLGGSQTFYLTETATGINEKQQITLLDIPVKLGVDYALTSKWSAFLAAGVAYGIKLSSTYKSSATITRTGYYPDYNALIYDVDVNGSPYYYPTNKAVTGSGDIKARNNLSFEGTLGAKYKLNSKVALYAGVKYMKGLLNVKEDNTSALVLANSGTTLNTLSARADKLTTEALAEL